MPRTAITVATPYDTSRTYRASQARKYAARQKRAALLAANRRPYSVWQPVSRVEKKTIDNDVATTNFVSGGNLVLLNGVATGTDFTDRNGRKIVMTSFHIKGFVYPQDTATLNNMCRLIIFYDSQANGATPAVTDIVKSTNALSQLNLNNRDRFRVIIDRMYPVGMNNNTATQSIAGAPTVHKVKIYRKLKLEAVFGGTGATAASIQTGSLWMLCLGSQATTDGSAFDYSTRVRFVDA